MNWSKAGNVNGILIYDKHCAGSKSYSSFADEFLKQENIMESAA